MSPVEIENAFKKITHLLLELTYDRPDLYKNMTDLLLFLEHPKD